MISIIIPVFNEADTIATTLNQIQLASNGSQCEIIVVDGGSTDNTVQISSLAEVMVVSSAKGRAKQMNFGASVAKGEVLYFLHADSKPPEDFAEFIIDANRKGFSSGCFRLKFDLDHWFLNANSWFTRFDINAVRFGDQSLFVNKRIFEKSGGYREDLIVMEDQEIIHRLKQNGKFKVLNQYVTTSARKYEDNGIFRMQRIFYLIWLLYYAGFTQQALLEVYKKLIRKHKL